MYTTSGTSPNPIFIEMEETVRRCFVADETVTVGQMVKLQSDGTITPVTAATDFPIGYVLVPAKDGKEATVSLSARAIVKSVADGSVTRGQLVSATADGYADSGNYDVVSGVALTTAADAAELEVAVLYNPFVYWVD